MKGRAVTVTEKAWINKACAFGCIVCATCEDSPDVPCSPHHIEGKTKPGAHFLVIGLCHYHHQADDNNPAYESVHGNKYRFEQRYGTQYELLHILQGFIGGKYGKVPEIGKD